MKKKLYALRGAVRCENNETDICNQVAQMYDALLSNNNLTDLEEDIVSVIFSVTPDLNAINPCTALRKSGRAGADTVLFSAQEPVVVNSLDRVVRVIVHCYLEVGAKARHVYINGAEVLRPDRAG
ncbi:MAG: chorismate mutase [Treponema sp.]|nr:chorismate mutase [Treponema sp.]